MVWGRRSVPRRPPLPLPVEQARPGEGAERYVVVLPAARPPITNQATRVSAAALPVR